MDTKVLQEKIQDKKNKGIERHRRDFSKGKNEEKRGMGKVGADGSC